jgi:hypothetical protein
MLTELESEELGGKCYGEELGVDGWMILYVFKL